MTDQGVTGVRNVKVRKNGVLKSTNTYVLTFNTPILPKKIKVAFLSVNIDLYSKSSKMLPMSGFWPPRRLLYEKADLWKLRWRKALQ